MTRSTLALIGVLVLLAGGLVGCQQPNMEEMMKAPARPAELDQLNTFVGTWEGTWEMTMKGCDKPMSGKGVDTFAWDADKWVMTEHSSGMMGDNKMVGTGIWVWDGHEKLFRYISADNYGMLMKGTMCYDAKTETWHMKGKTCETIHGHESVGEGTLKMVDANTMEWQMSEWDALHLCKIMEMKGTSHRK